MYSLLLLLTIPVAAEYVNILRSMMAGWHVAVLLANVMGVISSEFIVTVTYR